jgi:hypothetical protein
LITFHHPADIEPIEIRQHEIEDDEIRGACREKLQQGASIGKAVHAIPGLLEVNSDQVYYIWFVIHHSYTVTHKLLSFHEALSYL